MSNGKEINNGDTCFFNHRKHSIVARFISKTPPQTTRQLLSPHLNLSTESVSKFVETYSLDILNSNRFSPNQPFAQEIGILTSKFPLMSSLEVMSLEKLHQ